MNHRGVKRQLLPSSWTIVVWATQFEEHRSRLMCPSLLLGGSSPSSNPPLLVTVFFGANDVADPNAGVVQVPVAEYAENLHEIVAPLKKLSDSTKIIPITPPPVFEKNLIKSAQ